MPPGLRCAGSRRQSPYLRCILEPLLAFSAPRYTPDRRVPVERSGGPGLRGSDGLRLMIAYGQGCTYKAVGARVLASKSIDSTKAISSLHSDSQVALKSN